jgi:hypothetical protein
MRADPSGKATLPGVPPGTYFLMLSGRYNNQPLFWELKLDLKAGANTVTLDQRNASLLIAGALNLHPASSRPQPAPAPAPQAKAAPRTAMQLSL